MERVRDRHDVDGSGLDRQLLRTAEVPAEVGDARATGGRAAHLDHVRLQVDGEHVRKMRRHRKSDLPRSAGQVHEQATNADALDQGGDHHGGVARAEAVVVFGRSRV
jgi:hypothetical protein